MNAGAYVDPRPQVAFHHDTKEVTADITLPLSVDPSLRISKSSRPYLTEKRAKKDAAFEAYCSLYRAGLINDNLLPLKTSTEDEPFVDDEISLRAGPPRFDPWPAIATKANTSTTTISKLLITVSGKDESFSMTMCSPEMPIPSDFTLYWNRSTQYRVSVKRTGTCQYDEREAEAARQITKKVLYAAYGSRMSTEHVDFLTYFLPVTDSEPTKQKLDWTRTPPQHGNRWDDSMSETDFGIVMLLNVKYLFKKHASTDAARNGPAIVVSRFPKRRDL